MLARFIRNYKLLRAQRLVAKVEYSKAERIVRRLLEKFPRSVGYNLFLADIKLFEGDIERALSMYRATKQILDSEQEVTEENRRFYAAYMNFRTTAIQFHNKGQDFAKWREFATLINKLDADRLVKRLFPLPEQVLRALPNPRTPCSQGLNFFPS